MAPSRVVSALVLKYLVRENRGSSPSVTGFLVWNVERGHDFLSSARVDSALNGWLENSGKDKLEERAEEKDALPLLLFLSEGP